MRTGRSGIMAVVVGLSLACSRRAPSTEDRAIEARRLAKDEQFRTAASSPIPPAARASFPGLRHFPVDPAYRVEAVLTRFPPNDVVQLASSRGERRTAVRYGRLAFALEGRALQLTAFKIVDPTVPPKQLFVPFTDATTGRDTYGAGRYIDLEEEPTNRYALDFNLAYNPYCAYNIEYDCPYPPRENALPVAIRAGERLFEARP